MQQGLALFEDLVSSRSLLLNLVFIFIMLLVWLSILYQYHEIFKVKINHEITRKIQAVDNINSVTQCNLSMLLTVFQQYLQYVGINLFRSQDLNLIGLLVSPIIHLIVNKQ